MLNKLKTAFLPLILAAGTMAIEIQNNATDIASKRAETDLRDYIGQMGQAEANVKFTLSVDGAMKHEEWKVEGKGQSVAISGGSPRGLLYGVYHYLEDACGVLGIIKSSIDNGNYKSEFKDESIGKTIASSIRREANDALRKQKR